MRNLKIITKNKSQTFSNEIMEMQIKKNSLIFTNSLFNLNDDFINNLKENFLILESKNSKEINIYVIEFLKLLTGKIFQMMNYLKKNILNKFDYFLIISNYQKISEIFTKEKEILEGELIKMGNLLTKFNLISLLIGIFGMFLVSIALMHILKKIHSKIIIRLDLIGKLTERDIKENIKELENVSEIIQENKGDNYLSYNFLNHKSNIKSLSFEFVKSTNENSQNNNELRTKVLSFKMKKSRKFSHIINNIVNHSTSFRRFKFLFIILILLIFSSLFFLICYLFINEFQDKIENSVNFSSNILTRSSEISRINMINFLIIYQNAISFSEIIGGDNLLKIKNLQIIKNLQKNRDKLINENIKYFDREYVENYIKTDKNFKEKLYKINQQSICEFINQSYFNKENCKILSDGILTRGLILSIVKFLNGIKLKYNSNYFNSKIEVFLNSEEFFENLETGHLILNSFEKLFEFFFNYNKKTIEDFKSAINLLFLLSVSFFIFFYGFLILKIFFQILNNFLILKESFVLIPFVKIKRDENFAILMRKNWE